jgi:hypothetical protein
MLRIPYRPRALGEIEPSFSTRMVVIAVKPPARQKQKWVPVAAPL